MLRVANIESNIQGRPCNVAMLLPVSEHCRCKLFMGADQISGKLRGILQQLIGKQFILLQRKTSMYEIQGKSCSVAMLVSGSCRCKLFIRFLEG